MPIRLVFLLKATELTFPPPQESRSTSFPTQTRLLKVFFADKPLAVYEGETTLKVLLKADKSAHQGKQNFSGKLRVQACDNEVCYPPENST